MPLLEAVLEKIVGYKEYNPSTRCLTRPTKSSRCSANWKGEGRLKHAIGNIPITNFSGKRRGSYTPRPHTQGQGDKEEAELLPPNAPGCHDEARMRGGGDDYPESQARRRASRHEGSRRAIPEAPDNRTHRAQIYHTNTGSAAGYSKVRLEPDIYYNESACYTATGPSRKSRYGQRSHSPQAASYEQRSKGGIPICGTVPRDASSMMPRREENSSRQTLVSERARNGGASRGEYFPLGESRDNERRASRGGYGVDVRADVGSNHSRSSSRHPPDLAFAIERPSSSRHSGQSGH